MLRGAAARFVAATLSVAAAVVIASVASPVYARWKAPAPPAPGDTVVAYGPHRFTTPSGASTLGVEAFPLSWSGEPRFLLKASNGNSDGSLKATTFTVRLNGTVILTATDLGSAQTATRVVRPREQDTLSVQLSGPAGAFVDVSILQVADPTFLIKQQTFYRQSGSPILETVNFAAGAAAGSPFYMCLLNGREDGTHRNTSATITLNGQDVVVQSDLTPQVGSLIKPVTLQAQNVLEVRMSSIPLTEITLCFRATDILAPRLTITAPAQNFVTRDATVSVTGTVQDETPTIVTVNGTTASRSGDGYSATANLNEGANTILVHAVDAAGNTTDSTRNVIRDSQAPTIVLTSPANQSVTNNAQVTVAGTITDATVTTVNVNGTPVTLDANHAFSIVMTATEGSNFFTVTATDQAGNSTSEARQVTLDTAAPVVTIDAPADQLITNGMTVVVSGTVTDATPVTLTVNGLAVTPAANGSFSTTVALSVEGSNGITVVATDAATNSTSRSRTVIRDTHAPALTVNAPANNLITNQGQTTISGTVTDATALTLTVNGSPVSIAADGSFSTTITLGTEGGNAFTIVATDAATNHSDVSRNVIRDTQAPTLTIDAPAANLITSAGQTTISGTVTDQTALTLTVNGSPVTIGQDGSFSTTVTLGAEGSNAFTIVATDAATNHSDAARTVIRDTQAPALTIYLPADNAVTNGGQTTVTGTVTDATAITLTVNGQTVSPAADGSFSTTVTLGVEGGNVVTVIATDAAANHSDVARTVIRDTQAPTLTIATPANNFVTKEGQTTITGTVTDATAITLTVNGQPVTVGADGAFSATVTLGQEGNNAFNIVATDAATNHSDAARTIIRDSQAPTLSVTAPADGDYTKQLSVHVTGTVIDATTVSLEVNGVPTPLDASGAFDATVALNNEGANVILLRATDAGGTSTTTERSIIRDTQDPVLTVTAPADAAEFLTPTVTVTGTASDASPFRVTVNGTEVPVSSGSFSRMLTLTEGSNTLTVVATDTATNHTTVIRNVVFVPREPGVHPDPSTVAPPLNRTIVTLPSTAAQFLYTGTDPIQVGVPANTIDPIRSATIKGKVFNKDMNPMQGVKVSVRDHPEYGYTLSRMDGGYDLVVNGGQPLKVDYAKAGYLPSQRIATVAWLDWTLVDDVMLLQLDPVVTPITANSAQTQVARASIQTDQDGSRQVTAIFKPNTAVTMTLANGTTVPMTSMAIRATEFTVGANGHLSMPAELPTNSAYTYAMQMTADEALAAGATKVTFSKAVPVYIENFLQLTAPAGTQLGVPVGEFDPAVGWIGQPNGVVMKILTVAGGTVTIDLNNDGVAESDAALVAAGIDAAERQALALTYTPGASLWRFAAFHLYPYDANYQGKVLGVDPSGEVTAGCVGKLADPIKCDIQVARQQVPVSGTPFALNYQSDRSLGGGDRGLSITLTGPTILPILHKVQLKIDLAGRLFTYAFEPQPNLIFPFEWDGKDVWGRPMQGSQKVKIQIEHEYPIEYQQPAAGSGFAQNCTALGGAQNCTLNATTAPTSPRKYWVRRQWLETNIGGLDAKGLGLGGLMLSPHNVYDPINQVLYQGDGSTRASKRLPEVITTLTGGRGGAFSGDGGPAKNAQIANPGNIAVGPDGTVYFVDQNNFRIRKISPSGIISTIMGTGVRMSFSQGGAADGQSALLAPIVENMHLLPTPDGQLIVVNGQSGHVRKIDNAGIIRTIAGNGGAPGIGDGGPALTAAVGGVSGAALASDGSIFLVVGIQNTNRIRKIGPDGIINTVAGGDIPGQTGCGINLPAKQASLGTIMGPGATMGPDGSFYFIEWSCVGSNGGRLVRLTPDGMLEAVAGAGPGGDLTFARTSFFPGMSYPIVARDGSIYVTYQGGITIKIYTSNKYQQLCRCNGTVATDGNYWRNEPMTGTHGLALGPDGAIYASVLGSEPAFFGAPTPYDINRVRRIASAMPGVALGESVIPSDNGMLVYVFDFNGRHVRTADANTGEVAYQFGYDAAGRLISVNRNGRTTTIERDAGGNPLAMVGPDGDRTEVGLDANGYLSSATGPSGLPQVMTIGADGVLANAKDLAGAEQTYAYLDGKLIGRTGRDDGAITVTATPVPNGATATFTSPGTGTNSLTVVQNADGSRTETSVLPNGRTVVTTVAANGTVTTTDPDGTIRIRAPIADPRFGMASSLVGDTVMLPNGLKFGRRLGRAILRPNPADPTSVVQEDSTFTNGRLRRDIFDRPANRVTHISEAGRVTYQQMDANGRIVEEGLGATMPLLREFDSNGRVTRVSQGPVYHTYTYNSRGLRETATDALSRTTTYVYDAAGRLSQRINPDNSIVLFGYDANGNVTSVRPAGRIDYLFTFTAADFQKTFLSPDAGDGAPVVQWTYNADKQVESTIRADNRTIQMTYDAFGRQSQTTIGRGIYRYDYNAITGNLQTITAPDNGTLTFTYNGYLPTRATWAGTVNGNVSWAHDADHRQSSESVNGTSTAAFNYDADGLLIQAGALTISRSATNGSITGTTLTGVSTTQSNNSVGALATLGASFGATSLYSVSYTHDVASRVATATETINGVTKSDVYAYDLLDRLKRVDRNGTTLVEYEYDVNGNRTRQTDANGTIVYTYDAQDRMLTAGTTSYTYTKDGELATMTQGGATTTYTYDELGNLVTVLLPDGRRIDYVIDGNNRRVGKKVNGVLTTGFLYTGQLHIVAQLNGAGAVVSRFVYGTRANVPDYMVTSAGTFRLIVDRVGSVRRVINVANGQPAQEIEYDPFGRVISNTAPGFQPFGFAGGLLDNDTKLVRLGARDYDGSAGRWTAKDPAQFSGHSENLYTYAGSDPINRVDITGRMSSLIEFMVSEEVSSAIDFIGKAIGYIDLAADYLALKEDVAVANIASTSVSEALNLWVTHDDFNEDYIAATMAIYNKQVVVAYSAAYKLAVDATGIAYSTVLEKVLDAHLQFENECTKAFAVAAGTNIGTSAMMPSEANEPSMSPYDIYSVFAACTKKSKK